ncbi:uncharacterized protein LOC129733284 isoform X2 [Wyeomyia smithii]|uniref:uncharacterized protein LOC129733284 isoform X2 n=1 Tax=Wyeomyia smithii TaxID=174621 RepID=UPI002467C1EF|nr:uncharacterized protein LOC129733284 isoform X2 [Wyeomyia smithii]
MIHLLSMIGIIMLCISTLVCAGQLQGQIHEFKEFHESRSSKTSHEQIPRPAGIPQQQQMRATTWSENHMEEVYAFAEMIRQQYNRIIAPHDFMISTLQPYDTWNNFLSIQQQRRAEEISQQLVHNLRKGTLSPNDVMNSTFFVQLSANELNQMYAYDNQEIHQQHDASLNIENNEQQFQHQTSFIEFENVEPRENQIPVAVYTDTVNAPSNIIEIYNPITQQLEYYVKQHTDFGGSYDQSYDQLVQVRESVPTQKYGENIPKATITQKSASSEGYYSTTYEQQPIDNMQITQNVTESTVNTSKVMLLVRQKNTQKPPTMSNNTSFTEATTVSNIMSMLPHKLQTLNYTDIHRKILHEINKHLKNENETAQEETHFIGMTSNAEHEKLSYNTNDVSVQYQNRGDQPSTAEDFISENVTESEPGIGSYVIYSKPSVSIELSSSNASISNESYSPTQKPKFTEKQNLPYNAVLAQIPTTTTRQLNVNYFAPLAEFPTSMHNFSSEVTHYAGGSEINELNQETQQKIINRNPNGTADIIRDGSDQMEYEEITETAYLEDTQLLDNMQQFEDVQQSYVEIGAEWNELQQVKTENYGPLIQVSRQENNQIPQQTSRKYDELLADVVDTTTSQSIKLNTDKTKKNWFQRQWDKIKNL